MVNEHYCYESISPDSNYEAVLIVVESDGKGPAIAAYFFPPDLRAPVVYTKSCWALTFEQTCIFARSLERILEPFELNNLEFQRL